MALNGLILTTEKDIVSQPFSEHIISEEAIGCLLEALVTSFPTKP